MYVLDLDGVVTYSEDRFWWDYLPKKLEEKIGIPRKETIEKIKRVEETVRNETSWSSVDFWCKELGIKRELFLEIHLMYENEFGIKVYEDFVNFVKKVDQKTIYIATATDLKMLKRREEKVREIVKNYGKEIIIYTIFELGASKREKSFWKKIKEETNASVVVDDRPDYLEIAKEFFQPVLIIREEEYKAEYRRKLIEQENKFKVIRSLEELL